MTKIINKKEAEEIDQNFPDLQKLIADMFETMYHAKGVGLAAPQIGKSIRLFIVDGSPFADEEDEEPDPDAELKRSISIDQIRRLQGALNTRPGLANKRAVGYCTY